jgi:methionyl-tRNA formyltransferase
VRTLEAIGDAGVEIVGVVAHPPDPEDGVAYESVHDYARRAGFDVVRLRGRDEALRDFARDRSPDLIWITDYRYLVPEDLLAVAPAGAVNLHPSLLPRYRGRAPLNWAILSGESTLGLTAHFVNAEVDAGDVIVQREYQLNPDEDVGDALNKLYPLYADVTSEVLGYFARGVIPRVPQDSRNATVFPARQPEDGLISWSASAVGVRDLVRAVARPYPGAFTSVDGRRLTVWRARLAGEEAGAVPGTILAAAPRLCVACGEGVLELLEVEWEGDEPDARELVGVNLGG